MAHKKGSSTKAVSKKARNGDREQDGGADSLRAVGYNAFMKAMDLWRLRNEVDNDEPEESAFKLVSDWSAIVLAEEFADRCCDAIIALLPNQRMLAAKHLFSGAFLAWAQEWAPTTLEWTVQPK